MPTTNDTLHFDVQRLCIWSGALSIIMFTVGAIMADFLPPPSPSLNVDEVIAFYLEQPTSKRIGVILLINAAILSAVFVVQISVLMRQIEGVAATPLAWIQMLMGAIADRRIDDPIAAMAYLSVPPRTRPIVHVPAT